MGSTSGGDLGEAWSAPGERQNCEHDLGATCSRPEAPSPSRLAIVGSLAAIYLLFNSQTLSEAERAWCDQHMSQVAVAAMQVSPRPGGVIGEALAEHGANAAYWESEPGAGSLAELWRSSDQDTFNRACKFAVAFAKERSR